MPAPTTTLLIEGSFTELAEEFAQYLDALRKEDSSLQAELAPLLQPLREQEQNDQQPDLKQRDEVLKKLVAAAAILNSAPEKGELTRNTKNEMDGLKTDQNRNHSGLQSPPPSDSPGLRLGHVPLARLHLPRQTYHQLSSVRSVVGHLHPLHRVQHPRPL